MHDTASQTETWITRELAGSEFRDTRLNKRFRTLFEQLSDGIGESIPLVRQDWANTKAAYRFLSNQRVTEAEILSGHFQSTRDRFAATEDVVLVLQDTTEFSYHRADRQAVGILHRSPIGLDRDGKPRLSLRPLRSRLQVEVLDLLEKKKRRLHAKIVVFRGKQYSRLLEGSPNLTSPAWLRPAIGREGTGGNLEAATLRLLNEPGSIRRILQPVKTTKIEYQSLRYVSRPDVEGAEQKYGLVLSEAEVRDSRVVVRGTVGAWRSTGSKIRCEVEEDGEHFEFPVSVSLGEAGFAIFSAHIGNHRLLRSERPAYVSITVSLPSGATAHARAWLSRPHLLEMTAEERNVRNAFRQIQNQFFVDGELYQTVAQAINQFVGEVSVQWMEKQESTFTKGNGLATEAAEDPLAVAQEDGDGLIALDDYFIRDVDIAHSSKNVGGRMLSPLRELAKAIELLFLPSEGENEPSEDRMGIGDSSARKTKDHPNPNEGDIPPIAEHFIEQVASGVSELNKKIHTTPVRPDTVGYVLRLFEAIIGVLLLRMFIQAAIKNNPAAPRLASVFRATLTSAFSIDAVADGSPRGWFVRAWADDKTRPMLDQSVRDPDRLSRLAALVAAGSVLTQRTDLREPDAGMDEVLAGFGLVVGDAYLSDLIRLRPGVRQHKRRLAAQCYGLLDESALLQALSPIAVNTLPEVAAAIRWQPILALLNAEKAGVTELEPLEAAVKTSDPQSFETYQAVRIRRQPPIAFMRVVGGCAACSGCNTCLPVEIVARVRSRRSGCEICPGFRCGRILVPFALDSSVTMKILGQSAPELNRGLHE